MIKLFLEFMYESTPYKEKVKRDLLWYDSNSKKILKLQGGKLSFRYNIETEEMDVTTEDVESLLYKKVSNENDIRNWIEENKIMFDIDVDFEDNKGICIKLLEENKDKLEYSLDRIGIRYRDE